MSDLQRYDPSDPAAQVPASAGTSPWINLLLVAGVAAAIFQGGLVAGLAHFGRVFPAANSATVELPPYQK